MEGFKKLLIAGDLFPYKENGSLFREGDINTLFGDKICELFKGADLAVCNLEGALTDYPENCEKTGPAIYAHKEAINTYKALGIDCCFLANNHITDAGNRGVADTIATLEEAGIAYIGAGADTNSIEHYISFRLGEVVVGFYNVAETMYNKPDVKKAGAWLYDEYIVCRELSAYKKECDFLIVIYHGGVEKFRYPSPEIRKRFYRMAESGADAVISQHTHCIGCEEYYKGTYLLYGQGNFLFRNFHDGLTETGLILEVVFTKEGVSFYKHLVNAIDGDLVRYDDRQDLSDYYDRSAKVSDEEFVKSEFEQFCYGELHYYLRSFKSLNRIQKLCMRFFPDTFKKWLYSRSYNRRDLLFTLHTLRSEQNRETAIYGLENLLGLN